MPTTRSAPGRSQASRSRGISPGSCWPSPSRVRKAAQPDADGAVRRIRPRRRGRRRQGLAESGLERRALPSVRLQPKHLGAGGCRLGAGAVGGAVIDDEERQSLRRHRRHHRADPPSLVVGGDDGQDGTPSLISVLMSGGLGHCRVLSETPTLLAQRPGAGFRWPRPARRPVESQASRCLPSRSVNSTPRSPLTL